MTPAPPTQLSSISTSSAYIDSFSLDRTKDKLSVGENSPLSHTIQSHNDPLGRLKLTTIEGLKTTFEEEGMRFYQADLTVEDGYSDSGIPSNTSSPHLHPLKFTTSSNSATINSDQISPPTPIPKLRIVILLVGSRGDVQPYIALGKGLAKEGHFVRIAAHSCFESWIRSHGLDFANISGDPKQLLEMVVNNSMFSFQFVKEGLNNHRAWISQILIDAWNACTLENPNEQRSAQSIAEEAARLSKQAQGPGFAFAARNSTFRADYIIANPPAFSGWHIAEALGVPLLMSFPMPWSRTKYFPSPFTASSTGSSSDILNWVSYGAVDRLMWLGTGDLINHWRIETLKLRPIWTMSAKGHRYVHDYRVPFLYPWSPEVLPKPADWGKHICVSGYWFLDDSDGANWEPSKELADFFETNESLPIVYIGFGSIVVRDPNALNQTLSRVVIDLARSCRVIIQQGWTLIDISPEAKATGTSITIGPAPHRWLFRKCDVVVHHGGSGTTAEGLRAGIPTIVVPFFGDQFFWGATVTNQLLGSCIPNDQLNARLLLKAIRLCLLPEYKARAARAAQGMEYEDGVRVGVNFIERHFRSIKSNISIQDVGYNIPTLIHYPRNDESMEWRFWPYHDLKKNVKLERHLNPPDTLHAMKYKVKRLTSSILNRLTEPSVLLSGGGGGSSSAAYGSSLKSFEPLDGMGVELALMKNSCASSSSSSAIAPGTPFSNPSQKFPFLPNISPVRQLLNDDETKNKLIE